MCVPITLQHNVITKLFRFFGVDAKIEFLFRLLFGDFSTIPNFCAVFTTVTYNEAVQIFFKSSKMFFVVVPKERAYHCF